MSKLLIRLGFTIAAAAALVFLVLYAACYGEDMAVEYRHYSDAIADRSVERGWMPPFVPNSARAIREVHNIDTNRQWIRFDVPAADAQTMMHELMHVSGTLPGRPPRWSGRWPVGNAATGMSFYQDTTPGPGARCVIVEPLSVDPVTVYAWTC